MSHSNNLLLPENKSTGFTFTPHCSVEGLKKITMSLNQNIRTSGRNTNAGSHEYGTLTVTLPPSSL